MNKNIFKFVILFSYAQGIYTTHTGEYVNYTVDAVMDEEGSYYTGAVFFDKVALSGDTLINHNLWSGGYPENPWDYVTKHDSLGGVEMG